MTPRDRIIRWAVNAAFHLSIFGFVSVIGLVVVFAQPKPLKQTLAESGVYKEFVGALVEQSMAANQRSSVPLDDPQVQAIVQRSFSPAKLQQATETVIDASYGWAYGKKKNIEFVVDFSGNKRNLAHELSAYAFGRIENLPNCNGRVDSYDPFTANCRIFFESELDEQAKLTQQIYNNQDILPNPVVTDESLPKVSGGQRLDDAYKLLPKVMPIASSLPILLGGLVAALGLLQVRMSAKPRSGVRQVASGLLSDGGFLGASTLLFGKIMPIVTPGLSLQLQGSAVQTVLNKPFQTISNQIENTVLLTCFSLILIAVCMLLIERGTRPYSPYLNIEKRSGVAGAGNKARNLAPGAKLKPKDAPVVSSEQAEKRTKRRTKNKKYRKIKL